MYADFERFTIRMTKDQALSASHIGRCDEEVAELVKVLRKQLDKLDPDDIRDELREYGAWDAEGLADDEDNLQRIVWIAAGNIREDLR